MNPQSDSGIYKASVEVPTDANGYTIEQRNIRNRLLQDNAIGSIKHLYIISTYSGQVILYSTVDGKVTSSGKRLNPYMTADTAGGDFHLPNLDSRSTSWVATNEVLQDDGTYGSSAESLFWWDSKGIYHQHYVSGGQIVHVSSEPINVKDVIINLEVQ